MLDRELGAGMMEEPPMVGRVWHEDRGEMWRGFRCFWKALTVLRRAGRELRWSGVPGDLEAHAAREEKLSRSLLGAARGQVHTVVSLFRGLV